MSEKFSLHNLERFQIEGILSALEESKESMQSDLVHLEVQENKDDSMQEDIEFLTKEIKAIDELKEEIQKQTNIRFC